MLRVRAFSAVLIGLTLVLLLVGSAALLYGSEHKQKGPIFVTPKTGDRLYVLDRWFVSDLRMDGDELVLVLNIATYGKPKEPIRALGLVFQDKEKAILPFKNLVRALEGIKPRKTPAQADSL